MDLYDLAGVNRTDRKLGRAMHTWCYGHPAPQVLFLSFTPGEDSTEGTEYLEDVITPEADSRWFLAAQSPFVQHCGLFLYALEQLYTAIDSEPARLTGAVCDLSPKKHAAGKVPPAEVLRDVLAEGSGRDKLRQFLADRKQPIIVVNADPRWIQDYAPRRDSPLRHAILLNKNTDEVWEEEIGGTEFDRTVLTYELLCSPRTGRGEDLRKAIARLYKADAGLLADTQVWLCPGVNFSRIGGHHKWFSHFATYLLEIVGDERIRKSLASVGGPIATNNYLRRAVFELELD